MTYNEALRLLEQISEEIHRQRGLAAAAAKAVDAVTTSAAAESVETANGFATLPAAIKANVMNDDDELVSCLT